MLQSALRVNPLLDCGGDIPGLFVAGIEAQRVARPFQRRFELAVEEMPCRGRHMTVDEAKPILVRFERPHGFGGLIEQLIQALGRGLDRPDFLQQRRRLARLLLGEAGAGRLEPFGNPGPPLLPVRLHRPQFGEGALDDLVCGVNFSRPSIAPASLPAMNWTRATSTAWRAWLATAS